jgi:hypothetical protein
MVLGFVIVKVISRCARMSDGVCVDIVIGLLMGAKLLQSTEAYELFREGTN